MNNYETTSGKSYPYPLKTDYKSNNGTSLSCYMNTDQYKYAIRNPIVPPTPVSVRPKIFEYQKPHKMHYAKFTHPLDKCNIDINGNRNYNNGIGDGPYGSQKANSNTQDTYRKINMPNEALSCGGIGCNYIVNHFRPGFNDVSQYSK